MQRPHAGHRVAGTSRALARRRRANGRSGATSLGARLARRHGLTLRPGPHGLLVALHHPRSFPLARAAALCVGEVVLVRQVDGVDDLDGLLARWPRLLDHEARHAAQWARWGGPLGFLPAYGLAAAWSWCRHGDLHSGNAFEVRAGLADGGYRARPARPPRAVLAALLTRARARAGPGAPGTGGQPA